jgi:uncharacterized protein YoxC
MTNTPTSKLLLELDSIYQEVSDLRESLKDLNQHSQSEEILLRVKIIRSKITLLEHLASTKLSKYNFTKSIKSKSESNF